jgi:hypothetical protein
MEPNLNQMDDYNKPLSNKKLVTIGAAFSVLIVIYSIVYFIVE